MLLSVARRGVEPSPSHTKTHVSITVASESERRQSRVQKIPLFSAYYNNNIVDRRPVSVSQICRYAGCVRADLLFFFIWRERSARMAFFDMRTCPHIGPKLACRRPGTKYCVDLFVYYFRTLWNPPAPSLMLFFLPLTLRPNFSPWSLFLCQCSCLPVRDHPPPTSVSIARQRAVRRRGRWRLCHCCVVVGGGGSRGRGEFKNPKIIPYTEPTMMTERITPRSGSGTAGRRSTMSTPST